jgi:hypothetical protein
VTAYIAANAPLTPLVGANAAIHSYTVVYWVAAGVFAFGALLAVLLFRRRGQGLSLHNAPHTARIPVPEAEPALAH